jgi:hypothetical protein
LTSVFGNFIEKLPCQRRVSFDTPKNYDGGAHHKRQSQENTPKDGSGALELVNKLGIETGRVPLMEQE